MTSQLAETPESAPPANGACDADQPSVRVPTDVRSVALSILTFVVVIFALQYAQGVLIPIVLAVLVSYALEPLVCALERIRIPRVLAAAIVLVSVVSGGATLLLELSSQAQQLTQQMPAAARRFRQTLERTQASGTQSTIQQVQQAATELEKAADATSQQPVAPKGVQRVQIETAPIDIGDYLWWGSFGLLGIAAQLVLILFLTFFLLASGDLFRRKLVKIAGPSLSSKKVTLKILEDISNRIERFLLIQAFTSLIVGVVSWLAFRWVGLEQAAVWGLLAGIFNSIPYFGPVIVTGSIAIVSFMQFGTLGQTALAAGLALTITSLEGMLLTPWLTSRASQMNAVAIFVGLLFWGWVWNIWGVLLAVPILMAIKAICDQIDDFKEIGELLGE